jgi:hypothetical protein
MIFGRKQSEPTVGCDVVAGDDETLGSIAAVFDDYIEVMGSGIGNTASWRIPREAISRVDDEAVHLSVTRVQALAKGWQQVANPDGETMQEIPLR